MAVPHAQEQRIQRLYAAFNARDVEAVLIELALDVDWPNVLEGTRISGHDAVRAYWHGQFEQIDPHVEPLAVRQHDDPRRIAVDVRQVVRDLDGTTQADDRVVHLYTFRDGLIARMDVEAPAAAPDGDQAHTHRYTTTLTWEGSTAAGYADYTRAHEATTPPATHVTPFPLSSDPAFGGDPTKANPEQLLVLAASSCQMLSFLAVAARARIDVVAYEDDAEGVMPEDDKPLRITRIVLKPKITIRADQSTPDDDRLHQLTETAHRHCFIANSLTTAIVVEPTFTRTG
jgi:organic hydroperoxide reductase OsmC/OhrA